MSPPAQRLAAVVDSTHGSTASVWSRAWIQSFGARWYLDLAVMAVIVFCFGAVRPLSDPDLPMHLVIGEWIVRHGAFPLVEPFAWTRPGAPYYAYSWLPETAYYQVLRTFGHVGLRALQGALVVASAASVLVLAHALRWRASQGMIVAALNLIVGSFFVGYLRPQSILLITIPLIWAGVHQITNGRRVARYAVMIFFASAATANSHLFFPLTIAPVALFWVYPPRRLRDATVGVGSVLAGWMTSPYSLHWLSVFRHNFQPNLLVRPPSAITELQPGFVTMLYPTPTPMLALVAAMLAIPWALNSASLHRRERVLAGIFWGIGLVLFGYAVRLFMAWWLLALLPAGWAVVQLTRASEDAPPRVQFRLFGLVACLVLAVGQFAKTRPLWPMEGDTMRRTLPTMNAMPAERVAMWLERSGRAGVGGKVMSTFSFGSYLAWRLPRFSQSIDSRGLFPDSVLAAEAVVLASDRVPLGPWQSADLAILPLRYRVAAVLDTATGWRRIVAVPGETISQDSTGLWVQTSWWNKDVEMVPNR